MANPGLGWRMLFAIVNIVLAIATMPWCEGFIHSVSKYEHGRMTDTISEPGEENLTRNSVATCAAVSCGDPGRPTGGFTTATGYSLHSVASFTCQPGLVLCGAAKAECLSNGLWSSPPPHCMKKGCASTSGDGCGKRRNNWCSIPYSEDNDLQSLPVRIDCVVSLHEVHLENETIAGLQVRANRPFNSILCKKNISEAEERFGNLFFSCQLYKLPFLYTRNNLPPWQVVQVVLVSSTGRLYGGSALANEISANPIEPEQFSEAPGSQAVDIVLVASHASFFTHRLFITFLLQHLETKLVTHSLTASSHNQYSLVWADENDNGTSNVTGNVNSTDWLSFRHTLRNILPETTSEEQTSASVSQHQYQFPTAQLDTLLSQDCNHSLIRRRVIVLLLEKQLSPDFSMHEVIPAVQQCGPISVPTHVVLLYTTQVTTLSDSNIAGYSATKHSFTPCADSAGFCKPSATYEIGVRSLWDETRIALSMDGSFWDISNVTGSHTGPQFVEAISNDIIASLTGNYDFIENPTCLHLHPISQETSGYYPLVNHTDITARLTTDRVLILTRGGGEYWMEDMPESSSNTLEMPLGIGLGVALAVIVGMIVVVKQTANCKRIARSTPLRHKFRSGVDVCSSDMNSNHTGSFNATPLPTPLPHLMSQQIPLEEPGPVPKQTISQIPQVPQHTELQVRQQVLPEMPQQTQPKIQPPTQPKMQQPTLPKTQQPTRPKMRQPTQPKTQQPTQSKMQQPTQPKMQQPTQTKMQQPTQPKIPKPPHFAVQNQQQISPSTACMLNGQEYSLLASHDTPTFSSRTHSTCLRISGEENYTTSTPSTSCAGRVALENDSIIDNSNPKSRRSLSGGQPPSCVSIPIICSCSGRVQHSTSDLFEFPADALYRDTIPRCNGIDASTVEGILAEYTSTAIRNYDAPFHISSPTQPDILPCREVCDLLSEPIFIESALTASDANIICEITVFTLFYILRSDFDRYQFWLHEYDGFQWLKREELMEEHFLWDRNGGQESVSATFKFSTCGVFIMIAGPKDGGLMEIPMNSSAMFRPTGTEHESSSSSGVSCPTSVTVSGSVGRASLAFSNNFERDLSDGAGRNDRNRVPSSAYRPLAAERPPEAVRVLLLGQMFLDSDRPKQWNFKIFVFAEGTREPDVKSRKLVERSWTQGHYFDLAWQGDLPPRGCRPQAATRSLGYTVPGVKPGDRLCVWFEPRNDHFQLCEAFRSPPKITLPMDMICSWGGRHVQEVIEHDIGATVLDDQANPLRFQSNISIRKICGSGCFEDTIHSGAVNFPVGRNYPICLETNL
eukprot:scpid20811/ scgid5775/ CUB and sushi domain-containing protein 1; CUB and sushi multiple domains protein 1